MEPPLVRVLPSAELLAQSAGGSPIRRASVAGTDVLLGRLAGGQLVAFAASCPHQQTDLAEASFVAGAIRCPRHDYLYDLATGENVVPRRDADPADLWKLRPGYLPVYRVEERDGWIWVGPQPRPAPASYVPDTERPPPPGADRRQPAEPLAAPSTPGTIDHPTEVVRVRSGTTFELRLPTTPRPAFLWRVETDGQGIAVVGERRQPGHPGHHVVRLAARNPGRSAVRAVYARPWDRRPVEVRTYVVVVDTG